MNCFIAIFHLGLCAAALGAPSPVRRPDIVLIVADDLGFSDVGCYGGEIRTPHLDRLAAGGLRFTQFYNAARCCPTRASLLTGQYAHKVGLARNGQSLLRSGATIAELLGSSGYRTALSGKWHLSYTPELPDKELHQQWIDHRHDPSLPFAPLESYPVNRGFERHFGIVWGVVNHFDPFSLVEGIEPVRSVPADFHLTDAITDYAVQCVRDFSSEDEPFFLYVAHSAPHWPLHARPADIAHYRDKYRDGWQRLRERRWTRQLELGLFDAASARLPPLEGQGPDWDLLTSQQRDLLAAKMAVHAAMVDRLDQGVGKVVAALRQAGRLENTLVIFVADNGASPEIPGQPGYDRTSTTRDGRRLRYDRDGLSADEVGSEISYTGIGPRWASAANTPFRFWKKESFEGGAHTPCIVHWPQRVQQAGSLAPEVCHVIDVLPTLLELAGTAYPEQFAGHKLTPLDGCSFAPLLMNKALPPRGPLYFEHEGGRAVRDGDWKLVASSRRPQAWQLYDLKNDRTETRDLAAEQAQRVQAMAGQWQAWAQQVGVPDAGPANKN